VRLDPLIALAALRYRLLWAHARSRNGRIVLLIVGYLVAACLAVLLALGGVGAAAASIRLAGACSWPGSCWRVWYQQHAGSALPRHRDPFGLFGCGVAPISTQVPGTVARHDALLGSGKPRPGVGMVGRGLPCPAWRLHGWRFGRRTVRRHEPLAGVVARLRRWILSMPPVRCSSSWRVGC
jgi:hypothetical protein